MSFGNVNSKWFVVLMIAIFSFSMNVRASEATDEHAEGEFNVSEFILHHIADDYKWNVGFGIEIYLPVLAYNMETGEISAFSSKKLNHGSVDGYIIDHGRLGRSDEARFFDFSITRNVLTLFFSAFFLILIFVSVAKTYKRRPGQAPKGLQSFMEPIILFVRDEIAIPTMGEKKYLKYFPYLLTLFFFIFLNNLMGLIPIIPGGSNLTGNIAVTGTLAVLTLLIVNFSGNKHYWKHIFWTPGVPVPMKIPIAAIELIGIFTKPVALMIRLFANITAGHIIILSILSLTFIFESYAVGVATSLFALFMNLLELLVAALQAYIFTMLTGLFIGQAIEEPEHH